MARKSQKVINLMIMKFLKSHYLIIAILLASALLNLWNQDFPIEFHADERKKVRFVLENTQDFMHPTLLLQVSKAANFFFGYTEKIDIVHIGRTVSALAGVLIVFFSYLITRKGVGNKSKYFASIATALSPILVIHAHYFKEDMLFTAFFLMSLFALFRFLDCQNLKNTLFLGTSIGLAISSKYIAALIIPVALIAPFVYQSEDKKNLYKKISKSLLLAFCLFLLINYPLILDFKTFWHGLTYEIDHVLKGHEMSGYSSASKTNTLISITPFDFWFTFHLRYSLINGMTLPIVVIGLFGFVISLMSWKKLNNEEKLLILSVVLLYVIAECSPTKPFPDFMRYMIPVVPLLIYFAARFLTKIYEIKKIRVFVLPIATLCISYAAWDSSMLLYNLKDDTRREALAWMKEHSGKVKGEMYTMCDDRVMSLALLDIEKERNEGTQFFVASNFFYDRILFAKNLKKCPETIVNVHNQYSKLFSMPYIEFRPKHRSFAFSNPTIRIINIQEKNNQSLCSKSYGLLSIQLQTKGMEVWARMSRKS
jgi:hypothetical protein